MGNSIFESNARRVLTQVKSPIRVLSNVLLVQLGWKSNQALAFVTMNTATKRTRKNTPFGVKFKHFLKVH